MNRALRCGALHLILLAVLQERAQGIEQLRGLAGVAGQLLQERQVSGDGLRIDAAQRCRRRGRGRSRRRCGGRLRRFTAHGAGELLRQLHDLRHTAGIGQQRIEFFVQF